MTFSTRALLLSHKPLLFPFLNGRHDYTRTLILSWTVYGIVDRSGKADQMAMWSEWQLTNRRRQHSRQPLADDLVYIMRL